MDCVPKCPWGILPVGWAPPHLRMSVGGNLRWARAEEKREVMSCTNGGGEPPPLWLTQAFQVSWPLA